MTDCPPPSAHGDGRGGRWSQLLSGQSRVWSEPSGGMGPDHTQSRAQLQETPPSDAGLRNASHMYSARISYCRYMYISIRTCTCMCRHIHVSSTVLTCTYYVYTTYILHVCTYYVHTMYILHVCTYYVHTMYILCTYYMYVHTMYMHTNV